MGFVPSEPFPLEEPWCLSAPDAFLTFPHAARPASPRRCRHASNHGPSRRSTTADDGGRCRPPSRLCSPRESVAIQRGFRPPAARCSLGLLSLQGHHCPRLTQRFTPRSSRGLRRRYLPATEAADSSRRCPSEHPDAEAGRSLSRPTAPPEVSHLVTLLDSSKATAARAHGFASGPEPRHRAPSDPLWATAPLRPKPERQDVYPCFLPESVN
jgi:hypothetical protein